MRILMIDKNFFFDRRIALMCLSLEEMGHETQVVLSQPPKGYKDLTENERHNKRAKAPDHALKKIYFPTNDDGFILHPGGMDRRPPHVVESKYPFYRDPRSDEADIRHFKKTLKSGREGRFQVFSFASSHPQAFYKWLSRTDYFKAPIRFLGMTLLFPFVLFRAFINLFFAPPKDDFAKILSFSKDLDFWDAQVVEYALNTWVPDVICANDTSTLLAASIIKKKLGIPLVFDAHELYTYQPGMKREKAKKLWKQENKLLKNVDKVIVVNETHAAVVKRDFGITAAACCPNATMWPDDFDITKRYNWIQEKTNIPEGHKTMLFQGGINKERRIDFLLKGLADARTKNVHMVFLTFGQEVQEFKTVAAQLGIASRVHFLKAVPWDEMVFWAASADAGMMPYQATDQNTTLASPNKMYEFIMAGTPMIASSDLIYAHEIIEGEGFGVTVPLRDVPDYTLAIERMFDPALGSAKRFRKDMIENAWKYSWDIEVKPSMKMYNELFEQIKNTAK